MAPKRSEWETDRYRAQTKARFLRELEANGGFVERAIRAVKTSRRLINEERDTDPVFASAWERIIDLKVEELETEAARRARGYEEELVYQGKRTGDTVTRYSDNLIMFLLKAHRPERYRDTAGTKAGLQLTDAELDEALGRMIAKRGKKAPVAEDTELVM